MHLITPFKDRVDALTPPITGQFYAGGKVLSATSDVKPLLRRMLVYVVMPVVALYGVTTPVTIWLTGHIGLLAAAAIEIVVLWVGTDLVMKFVFAKAQYLEVVDRTGGHYTVYRFTPRQQNGSYWRRVV